MLSDVQLILLTSLIFVCMEPNIKNNLNPVLTHANMYLQLMQLCTSTPSAQLDLLLATWNILNEVEEDATSVFKKSVLRSCAVPRILMWSWIERLHKTHAILAYVHRRSLLDLNSCKVISFSLLLPVTVVN